MTRPVPSARSCRARARSAASAHIIALALGAADKGVLLLYETLFRPEEKRYEPWIERCRTQMHGALAELDRLAQARGGWLVGGRMTQADITVACVFTFLCDACN